MVKWARVLVVLTAVVETQRKIQQLLRKILAKEVEED